MTFVRRAAWWLAAPALAAVLYWRGFVTWFLTDDFGWLGMKLELPHDLSVLYRPAVQGTVRLLADRAYFLVFSSVFGFHALPFRLWAFATWCGAMTLTSLIGARLTGSRAAGLIAALLWAANPNLVQAIVWTSAYNQILCAFLILAAFYARLRWLEAPEGHADVRKWKILEWVAYLASFGALELAVTYPALVLLYHLCVSRRRWRTALVLFVPAVPFLILHTFFMPRPAGDAYKLTVDGSIASTFVRYAAWAMGPTHLGYLVDEHWRTAGFVGGALVGLSLAIFIATRLRARQFMVVFCAGWFAIAIAPVLPLRTHITEYYLTLPSLGIAWLGGWALVTAWRQGVEMRIACGVLAAIYFVTAGFQIDAVTEWIRSRTMPMHGVVSAVEQTMRWHPGTAIVINGVDSELFSAGFQDDPFRLFGAKRVFLAPGSEKEIQARADLGGVERFVISPSSMARAIESGEMRVLSVNGQECFDITDRFRTVTRANFVAEHHNFVDVGNPAYATRIGPTWHAAENGFRWMPKIATLQIAGPQSAGEKLYVTGYAAPPALAAGFVTLRFQAAGQPIGSATLEKSGEKFALSFPLPASLVGQSSIELAIEVSRTFHAPNDLRELGMIFGTFEVR